MRSAVLLSLIPLAAALPHVERASDSSSGSSSSSSSLASLAKKAGKLYFGTEASSYYFATKNYSAIEKAQFNQITPENEMKWEVIEPTRGNFNWTGSDLLMSVAKETKSYFRGHNFCWDSQNPPYVQNITTSAEALDILKEHIDAVMGRYGKDFYAFDVINEPVNENGTYKANPWYNALGESYIETALRYAHAAAPNVKLYINDYNIEGINNKSTALLGWVKALKAKGAPIHGVGFESHFIAGSVDPTIAANMKRFTDAGVDVAITELDIRTPVANDGTANSTWLSIQAADYANITSICVNNSGCPGITVWGFNDYFSWIPGVFAGMGAADLYDLKYQPKPALAAVRSALSK